METKQGVKRNALVQICFKHCVIVHFFFFFFLSKPNLACEFGENTNVTEESIATTFQQNASIVNIPHPMLYFLHPQGNQQHFPVPGIKWHYNFCIFVAFMRVALQDALSGIFLTPPNGKRQTSQTNGNS